jgi:mannose-1-phosphate guanylyltransferase
MKKQPGSHEKASNGYIVTFGIVPTKPKTYGYIERKGDDVISLEKTQPGFSLDFIAKGNFLWNRMFCFKAGVLLEESFHPEVYENQNWFGKATKWNLDLAHRWIFLPSALIMR